MKVSKVMVNNFEDSYFMNITCAVKTDKKLENITNNIGNIELIHCQCCRIRLCFWTANKKQVENENFFCVDYIAVV